MYTETSRPILNMERTLETWIKVRNTVNHNPTKAQCRTFLLQQRFEGAAVDPFVKDFFK